MGVVRVVDVALDPRRSGGSTALWTYHDEDGLDIGTAVIAPLGTRSTLGFVVDRCEREESELGFPLTALRRVQGRIEGLSLPAQVVELARQVAEDTLCPLPVALSVATPPGVQERLVTCWRAVPGDESQATTLQKEVLRVLREDGEIVQSKTKKIADGTLRALRALRKVGLATPTLRVALPAEKRKGESLVRLTADAERVEAFLKKEGKKKPAQALTLMRMQDAERGALTTPEIKVLAGVTESTLKALIDAGLLERVDDETPAATRPPTPNPEQALAIDAVTEAVLNRQANPFLLFGVTGSGKTEVFLRAASEALRIGRQVLYVVPEIALAAQAISLLRQRFGKSVAVLHSELPDAERLHNWMRIRNGDAAVVLGARSALFAPLDNVGLIILDEEHEAAYKQESAPRYHAKRVALTLGRLHRCPVVLGSATPSIESYWEAESGEWGGVDAGVTPLTLLSLPRRAAEAKLPDVIVQDLTAGYRANDPTILSPELSRRLTATLARGEQAILFLNRRAYAPSLMCRTCGHSDQCPSCSVSLSYHRRDNRLKCHHCGYQTKPPEKCPKCDGVKLGPLGIGTEKVEEVVTAAFPDTRVARLDRDIAKRKGALEEILAAFRAGDIGVLVGTQMVAKGLDFPNVTLVGVIAADVSLNIPDFRASERTFQLLSQVAGRAGRGRAPGTVVFQAFNPTHPAVICAQQHDFVKFYEVLSVERKEANYPPFRRLVNILVTGEDRAAVVKASTEAAARLKLRVPGGQVLGPADCAVERVQNRWRRHMLVKLPATADARPVGRALDGLDVLGVLISIDVDAYALT